MSFYGGKEGRSFVIAKEFQSITEMVENFKLGPSYNEVSFDEYVLINTINKNSPENGQLFRRGYDFDSDRKIHTYHLGVLNPGTDDQKPYYVEEIPAGGAIYVGTIVGPAGRAPKLNFGFYSDIEEFKNDYKMIEDTNATQHSGSVSNMIYYLNTAYPSGINANEKTYYFVDWEVDSKHYYFGLDKDLYMEEDPRHSIGWYSLDSLPKSGKDSFNLDNNLIPAVKYSGTITGEDGRTHKVIESYQDTVDWTYCTIRNENGEDSTAYLGMRIPSPVIEIEAESVDPYYHRNDNGETNVFTNVNLGDEQDTSTHPFYFKWNLKIPKGIKGSSIEKVYIVDASTYTGIKKFKLDENGNLTYNENGEIQVEDYNEEDKTQDRLVIVYDYVYYDRVPEGDRYTIYLGDFNVIDKISLAHNGRFTFNYTHNNTEETSQEDWIHWIDKMQFANDGTVVITFNDEEWNVSEGENQDNIENGVLTKSQLINWINDINLNEGDGELSIIFNNNNLVNSANDSWTKDEGNKKISKTLTWVKDISITEDGTVTTDYTTDKDDKVEKNKLKWVKDVALNPNDGSFIMTFNYDIDNTDPENPTETAIKKSLQWVKDILLSNDGTITLDYTNKDDEELTQQINWITGFSLNDNGELVVEFNNDNIATNSKFEKILKWVKDIEISEDGTITIIYNTIDKENENNENEKNILNQKIKWIKNMSIDSNMHLIAEYNESNNSPVDLGSVAMMVAAANTDTDVSDKLGNGGLWVVTSTAPEGDDF